jgi:hypothetical protein
MDGDGKVLPGEVVLGFECLSQLFDRARDHKDRLSGALP